MKLSCLFLLLCPSMFLCDPEVVPPTLIKTPTALTCTSFHLVKSGDTCSEIASEKGISISQFYAWNRGVGYECKDLLPGNYVCVGVLDAGGTPEPFQRPRPTPEPFRVQDLRPREERKWKATNTASSKTGSQPRTATRSYFGIRTDSKSLPTPTPSPIESGTVTGCQKFYKVLDNDTCSALASKAGILLTSFYKWNPNVGDSCQDLDPGFYVCIGV